MLISFAGIRNKRPSIASVTAVLEMLRLRVLRLSSHKRPDLIDLDAIRGNVLNDAVLILSARGTYFLQHYRRFLRDAEYVCHDLILPDRSGTSSSKRKLRRLFLRQIG